MPPPPKAEAGKKRVFVTHEDFVKAWTKGRSKADVAADLGMTEAAVSGRATALRKAGVKLKSFVGMRRKLDANDVKRLNALIAKAEDEEDDEDNLPAPVANKVCRSCQAVNRPEVARCVKCGSLTFEAAKK